MAEWAILTMIVGQREAHPGDAGAREAPEASEPRSLGEAGLVYMWNRWQDPDTGTFMSEDPAQDGSNWYSYAGANPMTYSDPTGLEPHGPGIADGYGPPGTFGGNGGDYHPSSTTDYTYNSDNTVTVHVQPLDSNGNPVGPAFVTTQPVARPGDPSPTTPGPKGNGITDPGIANGLGSVPGPDSQGTQAGSYSNSSKPVNSGVDEWKNDIVLAGDNRTGGGLPGEFDASKVPFYDDVNGIQLLGKEDYKVPRTAPIGEPEPTYGPENKPGEFTGPWADPANPYGKTPQGRRITRHYGVDNGYARNIPGTVVDDVIDNTPGTPVAGGKTVHYDPAKDVTVVTGDNEAIVSVHRGPPAKGER
jgi:RHS repeat-associated protein